MDGEPRGARGSVQKLRPGLHRDPHRLHAEMLPYRAFLVPEPPFLHNRAVLVHHAVVAQLVSQIDPDRFACRSAILARRWSLLCPSSSALHSLLLLSR